ncbi:hypothetical protein EK904_004616 [Melospiza melodia maxima]|nr:hypothetical protein EK904_004616 [Melospiza melodia maxima]
MKFTAPDPNSAMEAYRNISWVQPVTAAWKAIGRKKTCMSTASLLKDFWQLGDIYCFPKQHLPFPPAVSGKKSVNSMAATSGSQDPKHRVTSVTKGSHERLTLLSMNGPHLPNPHPQFCIQRTIKPHGVSAKMYRHTQLSGLISQAGLNKIASIFQSQPTAEQRESTHLFPPNSHSTPRTTFRTDRALDVFDLPTYFSEIRKSCEPCLTCTHSVGGQSQPWAASACLARLGISPCLHHSSAWVDFCSFLSKSHSKHFFLRHTNVTNPSGMSQRRNLPQKGTVTCNINSHQMHLTLRQDLHNVRENFTSVHFFIGAVTDLITLPFCNKKKSPIHSHLCPLNDFEFSRNLLAPLQSTQTVPVVVTPSLQACISASCSQPSTGCKHSLLCCRHQLQCLQRCNQCERKCSFTHCYQVKQVIPASL